MHRIFHKVTEIVIIALGGRVFKQFIDKRLIVSLVALLTTAKPDIQVGFHVYFLNCDKAIKG
jgi:hypothetical protein